MKTQLDQLWKQDWSLDEDTSYAAIDSDFRVIKANPLMREFYTIATKGGELLGEMLPWSTHLDLGRLIGSATPMPVTFVGRHSKARSKGTALAYRDAGGDHAGFIIKLKYTGFVHAGWTEEQSQAAYVAILNGAKPTVLESLDRLRDAADRGEALSNVIPFRRSIGPRQLRA